MKLVTTWTTLTNMQSNNLVFKPRDVHIFENLCFKICLLEVYLGTPILCDSGKDHQVRRFMPQAIRFHPNKKSLVQCIGIVAFYNWTKEAIKENQI
uniref:Uncharacterized protein n=1 Tax=Romanomermis culicivorax TaxID=13658 RepID=A0A915JI86_ROMCU